MMNTSGERMDSDNFTKDVLECNKTSVAQSHDETNLASSMGYLFLVVEILLMVVILVGNGLTITAIVTTPSLQTITYR